MRRHAYVLRSILGLVAAGLVGIPSLDAQPAGAKAAATPAGWPSGRAKLRFEVTIPATVRNEATTGRVFVILSRTNQPEPRLQVGRVGTPFFGHDIVGLAPGRPATVDGRDLGHPIWDLADIPPGTYWVQTMVNIYSEFRRGDGKVVWMHDDQWEGQQWNRSPGNLYSTPRQIAIDPMKESVVQLNPKGKVEAK